MSMRDREVLELLRDEPELLAIADAVAETERGARPLRPMRWLAGVAVAAAVLFALVLASPWERGGGSGTVLGRALAAIETRGPVLHLTLRMDLKRPPENVPAVTTESFYDRSRHLVRMVSTSEGRTVSDYTTTAIEDEFSSFPGLLDEADFYRKALETGEAKVVGKGEFRGRPVYWVELEKGGGFSLRIGVDRDTYQPVVFRGLNPDGTPAGFQLAVLGFEYVPRKQAALQPEAPILVTGRVVGPDCRPLKARVAASISDERVGTHLTVDQAVGRTSADGTFTLRADPTKSPFREALAKNQWLNFDVYAIAGADTPKYVGFSAFPRFVKDGRWLDGEPEQPEHPAAITIPALAKSEPDRICNR
jgi:hypothetical protein